jgi:protease-4
MTTDTNNPSRLRQALRIVLTLAGAALGGGLSYLAFQQGMANTDLSMFAIATILSFAFFGGKLAWEFIDINPDNYNVGLVEVKGPIQRDSPPKLSNKDRATADEVVDNIEQADNDSSVDALVVRLNTPGGEIVPSEDIKLAIEDFDGPVIGHAIDVCASGGYLIASACDEIICRNGSMIGSIGVIGSRTNYNELAEELGINYEQFTAGDYKDAGSPLKEMDDDERDYIQNLIDTHYENFVQTVADGRNMSVEAVKNTEAKVFLGSDALEKGLVDGIGTEDHVLLLLKETLSTPDVEMQEFSDNSSALARLSIGAQSLAYSFGAGIADRFKAEDDRSLKMEYR